MWREAANSSADFEPPEGPYKVRIIGGNADISNAGDPKAKVVLEIIAGELAGKRFEHFMWMGHEVSRRIHREALLTYGLREDGIEDITDLDDRIVELFGTTADVGVSYKDGRMNVKVHGSRVPQGDRDIPTDPAPAAPAPANGAPAARRSFGDTVAAKPADDDDIPF